LKIAIVTDIHHGPTSHNKEAGWNSLDALRRVIDCAIEEQVDLLLDLGDHISDTCAEADYIVATEVAELFKTFPCQRVHVMGNHDVANLDVADNEAIYGESMQSRVVDLGVCRLIVWQPRVEITMGIGLPAAEPSLAWLVAALNADERPAIIATHVPLSGHSQTGNYYFENNPKYASYPDHQRVRQAVEATGKAALWLSGHVHWNTVTQINNLPHITIQSLSERFTTFPKTAESWALLTLTDNELSLEVRGNDPFYVRLPFNRSGDKPWITPTHTWTAADFADFVTGQEQEDA